MAFGKKWCKGKGFVGFVTDHRNIRSMENYAGWGDTFDDDQEVFENTEFEDRLTYTGYEQGRSRVNMVFQSEKFDARVYMFMKDFDEMMLDPNSTIADGKLDGTFTFTKRGANYGIKKVLEVSV